jgi:hypothetical protein
MTSLCLLRPVPLPSQIQRVGHHSIHHRPRAEARGQIGLLATLMCIECCYHYYACRSSGMMAQGNSGEGGRGRGRE